MSDVSPRAILAAMGDPVLLIERGGEVVHGNPAALDVTELQSSELQGRALCRVIPRLTDAHRGELFDTATSPAPFEASLLARGGAQIPVEVRASTLRLDGQTLLMLVCRVTVERTGARMRAELLQAITRQVIDVRPRESVLPEVVGLVASTFGLGYCALFDLTANRLTRGEAFESGEPGSPWHSIDALTEAAWGADGPVWRDGSMALVVRAGALRRCTLYLEFGRRLLSQEIRPIEDTLLAVAQAIGVFEQRRAREDELRIRNRAIDASIDGITISSVQLADSPIVYVNEGFEKITGYGFDEAVGYNCRFLQGAETSHRAKAELRKAIEERRATRVTILNYRKSGEPFWNDLHLSPVHGESGEVTHFVAVQRDITARVEMEEDLVEARQRANSASRAKSRFLANMSHELRSPMTAILGFADAIARESTEGRTVERVSTIRRNADYLLRLIGDILDISRIEAGKLTLQREEVDLPALIVDATDLMAVRADAKELPLAIEVATPLPSRVVTDPTRVRQVLLNLLANAIKFTDEGEVRLLARAEMAGDAALIEFVVSDTGVGIAPEALAQVFQPFSRPHEADSESASAYVEGSGLGLSIVKRLVETLGGSIDLESTPGQGTSAILRFPMELAPGSECRTELPAASIASQPPRGASPDDEQALAGASILVADDRPDVAAVVEFYLEEAGAEVVLASDGVHVLRQYESHPDFDAVVLDMQMPVMDGFTAARELRERGYGGPILALTAGATREDARRCIEAGCTEFLSKPAEEQELIDTLARALQDPPVAPETPGSLKGRPEESP